MGAGYDVIVVGARVAGCATAMQLARRGLRTLVLDRAARGADTSSTHALLEPGIDLLDRWGLADRIAATGTPPIESSTFHYEGGEALVFDLSDRPLFAPRRTVIDPLLGDAAADAGADIEYGRRVLDIERDSSGQVCGVVFDSARGPQRLRAGLVVGADGARSLVARSVAAKSTFTSRHSSAFVFAYFEGLPSDGYHWYFSRRSAAGLVPTNNGQTCVFAGTGTDRFAADFRTDVESGFYALLDEAAPSLGGRGFAHRSTRFRSFPGIKGFTRMPWGRGWALVGDAGAFTDPMSAHGMTAALRDSVLCADAIVAAFEDPDLAPETWAAYEATRDRLTIPFIRAVDRVTAFRYDMDEVQQAHITMSRAAGVEAAELAGRESLVVGG